MVIPLSYNGVAQLPAHAEQLLQIFVNTSFGNGGSFFHFGEK